MALPHPTSAPPPEEGFSLGVGTGLVRSRRLLQSSERFNLTVTATDKGSPALSGHAFLLITIIDVNDNRPVFIWPTNGTTVKIYEVCWEGCVCVGAVCVGAL